MTIGILPLRFAQAVFYVVSFFNQRAFCLTPQHHNANKTILQTQTVGYLPE
jgi:hypothetical protein